MYLLYAVGVVGLYKDGCVSMEYCSLLIDWIVT